MLSGCFYRGIMNVHLQDDDTREKILNILSKLNGFKSNFFLFSELIPKTNLRKKKRTKQVPDLEKITFNQLNELQIVFGYQSIPLSFFTYLLGNNLLLPSRDADSWKEQSNFEKLLSDIKSFEPHDYQKAFEDLNQLEKHVDIFRTHALLYFGNIPKCLNIFTESTGRLIEMLEALHPDPPSHFTSRADPFNKIIPISAIDTYYLGYLIQDEIKMKLEENPNDKEYLAQDQKMKETINHGIYNNNAYLATDIIDVYIATSMREKEDYYLVNRYIDKLFKREEICDLKVSYFDPTQAYCTNRIDKGLSEALMLKKAICTIYFIQESDTFGKDSELASTLAQGKPVIAFLPNVDHQYLAELEEALKLLYPTLSPEEILLKKMKDISPKLAWENDEVCRWITDRETRDVNRMRPFLLEQMKKSYDKRYTNLKNKHPLGIQVNISNGVANGVLVVRTIEDCAKLLNNILKSRMQYNLHEADEDELVPCLHLKEAISDSIYRVATKDYGLTNSFWNYYTDP